MDPRPVRVKFDAERSRKLRWLSDRLEYSPSLSGLSHQALDVFFDEVLSNRPELRLEWDRIERRAHLVLLDP